MQQQHYAQQRLFHLDWLILASLTQEPKDAIARQEVIEQAEGLYVEPGMLYRLLAQLEGRGWIEGLTIEQPLRLYQITISGRLAFEQAGAGRQTPPGIFAYLLYSVIVMLLLAVMITFIIRMMRRRKVSPK